LLATNSTWHYSISNPLPPLKKGVPQKNKQVEKNPKQEGQICEHPVLLVYWLFLNMPFDYLT
jgi:hypothetical protein